MKGKKLRDEFIEILGLSPGITHYQARILAHQLTKKVEERLEVLGGRYFIDNHIVEEYPASARDELKIFRDHLIETMGYHTAKKGLIKREVEEGLQFDEDGVAFVVSGYTFSVPIFRGEL